MSFGSTNPQDLYKEVVKPQQVAIDPETQSKQNNFVQALMAQMNGQGPSVAGETLRQNTQANAGSTNALISGQRGVNPGLAFRQALMANNNANQAAQGQAAVSRRQEQLGATGMLGTQLNTMQNQNLNAQESNQNAGLGAAQLNTGLATKAAENNSNWIGSALNTAGSVLGMAAKAFADGGEVGSGPTSFVGKHLAMSKSGKVPALVSPGERYLSPKEVEKVAEGKKSAIKAGEKIPGKAKVAGAKDSYANDTVAKTLDSGGIVLPRHVTQAKDAPEKAAAFVRAVLAKQGLKK